MAPALRPGTSSTKVVTAHDLGTMDAAASKLALSIFFNPTEEMEMLRSAISKLLPMVLGFWGSDTGTSHTGNPDNLVRVTSQRTYPGCRIRLPADRVARRD
ncbi:MAG: hypothetical protein WBA88_24405 [Pseudaminobacter sp.]